MRTMRDESGGIEGMPLQLLIAVVVAGLVLAIVLGWVLAIDAPAVIKGVSTDPATVDLGKVPMDRAATKTVTIRVTAYDARDQPIPNAIVTIRGAAVGTYVAQDRDDGAADGTVTVANVRVNLPPNVSVGELSVTVHKSGYPAKTWTVPVVRGA